MHATPATLAGSYVLATCNGAAIPEPVTLTLSVEEANPDAVGFMAKVTNFLRGSLTLSAAKEDGSATLKGMLMSTRMMGSESQMKVERVLSDGAMEGCTVKLHGSELSITNGTDVLVFTKQ